MALFYVKSIERESRDPQEERAMALLRKKSIDWSDAECDLTLLYAFRSERDFTGHIFLECESHQRLQQILFSDPLALHCTLDVMPLLTSFDAMQDLQQFRQREILTPDDFDKLRFHKQEIDQDESHYLIVKGGSAGGVGTGFGFSPLLPIEDQNRIHDNTLSSQRAHFDAREVADFNPVGMPVGILIMKAEL